MCSTSGTRTVTASPNERAVRLSNRTSSGTEVSAHRSSMADRSCAPSSMATLVAIEAGMCGGARDQSWSTSGDALRRAMVRRGAAAEGGAHDASAGSASEESDGDGDEEEEGGSIGAGEGDMRIGDGEREGDDSDEDEQEEEAVEDEDGEVRNSSTYISSSATSEGVSEVSDDDDDDAEDVDPVLSWCSCVSGTNTSSSSSSTIPIALRPKAVRHVIPDTVRRNASHVSLLRSVSCTREAESRSCPAATAREAVEGEVTSETVVVDEEEEEEEEVRFEVGVMGAHSIMRSNMLMKRSSGPACFELLW